MTPECTGLHAVLREVPSKKVGTKLKVRVERKIGAETLSFETGELAKQAAGSCLVQYGETVVLVASATGPPGWAGFLPADMRLSRARGRRGQVPGRISQA